jgi:CRISPR-associated endonuclease Cas3-HD
MPPSKKVTNLLANSTGQPLLGHLAAVAAVARAMAEKCGISDTAFLKQVEAAGWTHDLGKATKGMQDVLAGRKKADEEFDGPLHHEISWAFLASKFGPFTAHQRIFGAVYWHHARPFGADGSYYETRDEILEQVSKADRDLMAALFDELPLADVFRVDEDIELGDSEVPSLFVADGVGAKDENARHLILRTCVVAADRLVSSLGPDAFNDLMAGKIAAGDLVSSLVSPLKKTKAKVPKHYEGKRYKLQERAALEAARCKTSILRAPAGFGKTLTGLLWLKELGFPGLWVTPRNVVAEAVYRNLCKEIDALGLELSVELHLTGERKEARGADGEFACDIVVTNIDTVLAPMVENRTADRLFRILSAPMVLDEFHELAGDSPLFAAFITLMRARHRICGVEVKTLLCSATPSCMEDLWDTDGNLSVHIPKKGAHLPPAHAGTYEVRWKQDKKDTRTGLLKVCNAVATAQKEFESGRYHHLAHSRFIEADRKALMDAIYSDFGKGGSGVAEDRNAAAALVIQAAMDVSFLHLEDNVCSPEFTLQRIGRTDRWGNFQSKGPSVTLALDDSLNENAAVGAVYDRSLRDDWVEHLKKRLPHGSSTDLKQLYEVYNGFYAKNRAKVTTFIQNGYRTGIEALKDYYFPRKPRSGQPLQPAGRHAVAKRSLRNPFANSFFVVRDSTRKWIAPEDVMDEDGRDLRKRFAANRDNNRKLINNSAMRTMIKQLHASGYRKFKRYLKTLPSSLDHWLRIARNPQTPLPDFTRTYDKKFGLRENKHITTP